MNCFALSFWVGEKERHSLATAILKKIMEQRKVDLRKYVIFLPGNDVPVTMDDYKWVGKLIQKLPDKVTIVAEGWAGGKRMSIPSKVLFPRNYRPKRKGDIVNETENMFFLFEKNRIPIRLGMQQLFSHSSDVKTTPSLYEELANQINRGKRTQKIQGKYITAMICGENNILANRQSDANRPFWRLDTAVLRKTLDFSNTLLFNPLHLTMGNGGKLHRRFEFLTSRSGYCRSALVLANRQWGRAGGKWPAGGFALYRNGKRKPVLPFDTIGDDRDCIVYQFTI